MLRRSIAPLVCLWIAACSGGGAETDGQNGDGPAGSGGTGAAASGGGGTIGSDDGAADDGLGSGPASGGMGGAGGPDPDVENGECDQFSFETLRKPAEMLLLLDRSASMDENEIAAGVTRWEGVVPVVCDALVATDLALSWGLKTFPQLSGDEYYCTDLAVAPGLDVPIAPANAQTIVAEINLTTPEGDGTPTGAALDVSVENLLAASSPNPKYILLATDGQPSCDGNGMDADEYAVDAAARALEQGIPVFVVGVLDEDPSDGTVDTLNEIAIAGGRPRDPGNPDANQFYLASTSDELLSALTAITGQVATCEFPFADAPPDPSNIAVRIDGETLEQDPTHVDGWDYVNDSYRGIEIFGPMCDSLKTIERGGIDVIFGCPGIIIK